MTAADVDMAAAKSSPPWLTDAEVLQETGAPPEAIVLEPADHALPTGVALRPSELKLKIKNQWITIHKKRLYQAAIVNRSLGHLCYGKREIVKGFGLP